MKILVRLSFLILVPIIVGLALVLSGYNSIGSMVLAFGTPAVMIILFIVGIIMMMKGKLFNSDVKDKNMPEQTEKEKEQAALNEINSSKYYTSQFNLAEYEAGQIAEGTKNASKKGMAAVIIVIILLLADVALAVTFTILNIWVGAIVCVSIFGATIIISLITAVIRKKISMNGDISKARKIVKGRVKSCVMSGMGITKSTTPTVRVTNVDYRVTVSAEGDEYVAFSKQFFATDEIIVIAVTGKKRAKIIDASDLENLNEEVKSKFSDDLKNIN